MVPANERLPNFGLTVGLGAAFGFYYGLVFKVVVGYFAKVTIEHPDYRMKFHDDKFAAGL